MKVLANDGLGKEGIDILEEAGISVDVKKRDKLQLLEDIAGFDGLIVRSATKVDKEVIEAGYKGDLKVIGRAGVGLDNIDVDFATRKAIIVEPAPHGNTNSTAEMAVALMFELARKISQADACLKSRVWRKRVFTGIELSGKTLGIIGCGRIGQRVGQFTRGFMKVIGYDIHQSPDSQIEYVSKKELLIGSDFISIHVDTKDLVIGSEEIDLIKPSAYLVNLARAKNVDHGALYKALVEKRIAGAALDVHLGEPTKEAKPGETPVAFDNPFVGLENVVLTPHLGASTSEGQARTGIEVAELVRNYLLDADYSGAVNTLRETENGGSKRTVYRLQVHNQNVPGVFGRIEGLLGRSGINIREPHSAVMQDEKSANTIYLLDNPISEAVLDELKRLEGVFRVRTY